VIRFFLPIPFRRTIPGGAPSGRRRKEPDPMPLVPFDQLPGESRLWIFAADRLLDGSEKDMTARAVEESLAAWSAHGSPVTWGYLLVHDQFLMIGVDEGRTRLTGCSIDHAVHRIQELEARMGISWLDNERVFYRDPVAGPVRWTTRAGFRELVGKGMVDADTLVFNNVLARVSDFRSGCWEVPARDSWHARAFGVRS
jgi:hypothetical protein